MMSGWLNISLLSLQMSNKPWRSILVTIAVFFLAVISIVFCSSRIPAEQPKDRTLLGNEIFCQEEHPLPDKKRLGLVINSTSLLPEGIPLIDALLEKEMNVTAIFAPEHGLAGKLAGGISVTDSRYRDIPVFSLYGKTKKPLPEQISLIDAFVYDIQDIGTRFYTYITTLKYVIESAASAGIPVYILDRPNPIGGNIIEGPCMRPEFESYIGAFPIPVRYGLTIGELAMMMKGEGWVPASADLHVVPVKNWKRDMFWEETGLSWISPSPNIPSSQASLLFPGIALLGEVGINGGVGTENPFLQFGAPWLNTEKLLESLLEEDLQGIELKIIEYAPQPIPGKILKLKYQEQTCRGIRINITEPNAFRSLRFSLLVLTFVIKHQPDWLSLSQGSMNRLFGSDHLSQYVKREISIEELMTIMERDENAFRKSRQPYLLYD